ncbi:MAG: glycoside hydrolase family 3 C-terminal domain-containing protein [Clostridia bacterium]|nr:glycoside hydrolase family 3 C-terminal domain-containing protein [Clostridia bacterium]
MKLDLSTLTIDEKIALLVGRDVWHTETASGKLPSLTLNDGPSGLRQVVDKNDPAAHPKSIKQDRGTASATAMPTLSALSCTWNPELAFLDGQVIADDCIERNADVLLAPGVNIKRTPVCGRNFEYLSEDPYLAGEMAKSFINGVQSSGVGTSLKHFCLNNIEVDRLFNSSEADERTVREIYLPAFEKALEAKPWTVMCAYNQINGIWASENRKYLKSILREELGFDGLIMSDWGATHDAPRALKATLDLTMPHSSRHLKELREAYNRGEITEGEIDERVEKLLELIEKCKNADKKVKRTKEERHAAAVKIAEEAIVLLKNDNNTLPIRDKRLMVIGEMARNPSLGGGGSSFVYTAHNFEPLENLIKQNLCEDTEFISATDAYSPEVSVSRYNGLSALCYRAMEAESVILCIGNNDLVEIEGVDRSTIKLSQNHEKLILTLAKANPKLIVILYTGSAIDMSVWKDSVAAIVQAGFGGEGISEALANVLTGKVSPSGKLTESYPMCLEDNPTVATRPSVICKALSKLQNSSADKYTEGVFVGYRYYDTTDTDVLFPFGHGLSYADFRYTGLTILQNGDTDFTVSLTVTNTSDIPAKETVQLYVSDIISTVERPDKELKGFAKIDLAPGESKQISMNLDYRSFAFYNVSLGDWHVENGDFDILVGASSRDIRLKGRIRIALPREKQYTVAK